MADAKKLQLTDDECTKLSLPVTGEGGFQNLLRKLQHQLQGNTLAVYPEDLARAVEYSKTGGGWQERVVPLVEAAEGRRAVT
jgi:hypothetical protein